MEDRYLVSIPIETVTRATTMQSRGYGLNELQLADILHVRVERTTTIEGNSGTLGAVTYLDIEVSANNRNDAILQAYAIAQRFVQLTALVYQAEFEISLVGVQAKNLTSSSGAELSSYFGVEQVIASFEPLLKVWEQVTSIQEQNSELWNVLKLALEWLHFGAIANDDRSAFLAYRIALEVLVKGNEGSESSTTVLNKHLDTRKHKLLNKAIRGVIALYIDDDKALNRLMQRIEDTLVESEPERWARILENAGVAVSSEELNDLRIARGSVVHSGIGNEKMSTFRVREIVVDYINALLTVNWE